MGWERGFQVEFGGGWGAGWNLTKIEKLQKLPMYPYKIWNHTAYHHLVHHRREKRDKGERRDRSFKKRERRGTWHNI
jgi:hypothetical protein